MDEFEKRLKRDAAAIEAEVPAALRARIDASLHGVQPVRAAAPQRPGHGRLWWLSSLTGLAAAAMVIVLINWNRQPPEAVPFDSAVAVTVPDEPQTQIPPAILDIRKANFTSPLEEELVNLQSDLEKARETVRKDLDFTF